MLFVLLLLCFFVVIVPLVILDVVRVVFVMFVVVRSLRLPWPGTLHQNLQLRHCSQQLRPFMRLLQNFVMMNLVVLIVVWRRDSQLAQLSSLGALFLNFHSLYDLLFIKVGFAGHHWCSPLGCRFVFRSGWVGLVPWHSLLSQ